MLPDAFRCYLVTKTGKDNIRGRVEQRPMFDLPTGDVLVRVEYSSVNYKDALATKGHPGVVRRFPHVPGIDAAGTVVESSAVNLPVGQPVVVTSYELGVERWGGWSEYARVSSDWVVPVPDGLSLEESMVLGTAGLTAGFCVSEIQSHGVDPSAGEVLVTGATGGVGSLAVMLLSKLGYQVVAVSGKKDRVEWLRQLGAARVVAREEVLSESTAPLLSAKWAGAVDTAGGPMLASLLRMIKQQGCVACCGLVAGAELATTVYPFILRGVTLAGVDSAWATMERRREMWRRLANEWKPDSLSEMQQTIGWDELQDTVDQMLQGKSLGRYVLKTGVG